MSNKLKKKKKKHADIILLAKLVVASYPTTSSIYYIFQLIETNKRKVKKKKKKKFDPPSKIKMLEDPSLFPFSIQFQSNQPSIKPETSPYFFLSHLFPNFPKNWMKEQIKRKKKIKL